MIKKIFSEKIYPFNASSIKLRTILYALCISMIVIFVILLKLHYIQYAILSIFVLGGVGGYILVEAPLNEKRQEFDIKYEFQSNNNIIFSLIFGISYCLSISYLYFIEPFYSKSLPYYFLIGICMVSIFVLSFNTNIYISSLIPTLIFLLGLNIYWSNFIVFPAGTYASGDTHFQIYNIIIPIINNGEIPSGYVYTFFPNHQLFVSSVSMIANLDPTLLYKYLPGLIYAFSGSFYYLLGNRLFNSKINVICMLLYLSSPNVVYHATHAYQFSYAVPIATIVLFLALLLYFPQNRHKEVGNSRLETIQIRVLLILFTIALILTHQFTSTVTFLLLLVMISIFIIYRKNQKIKTLHSNILSIYLITMLFHWMFISSRFSKLLDIVKVYYSSLVTIENYQAAAIVSQLKMDLFTTIWIQFIETLGTGILFTLAVIGSLNGLRTKNIPIITMTLWGGLIWVIVCIGRFIKMPLLLGNRLLTLFWIISIVPLAAMGIMILLNNYKKYGMLLCCLLMFTATISNLGCSVSGPETSIFAEKQIYSKLYDTERDIISRVWIIQNVPESSQMLTTESWILQYCDRNRDYEDLKLTNESLVDISKIKQGEYIILNSLLNNGIRVRGVNEFSQLNSLESGKITTIEASELRMQNKKVNISDIIYSMYSLNRIYSDGEISISMK